MEKQAAGWWRVIGATAGIMLRACPETSQQTNLYVAAVAKMLFV